MIYLVDNNRVEEPGLNLALEEYCLRELDPERSYLILYVNRPCVVVGKHQNILAETDVEFLRRRNIPVLRRISGGGAVYHDRGNLNIAFIQTHNRHSLAEVRNVLDPLRTTLHQLTVESVFDDRNNLFIGSGKISGNAQFSDTRRILIHATLLYDSDLRQLGRALAADTRHLHLNAPRSIPSAVTNVCDHLAIPRSLERFRSRLLGAVAEACGGMQNIRLAGRHWDAVDRLHRRKYLRWNWNWGKTPPFRIHRSGRGAFGAWDVHLEVRHGKLTAVRFTGALRSEGFNSNLEKALSGVRFEPQSIRTRLEAIRPHGLLPPGRAPETVADLLWPQRSGSAKNRRG